jgi:anti-sigma B factor antagonist
VESLASPLDSLARVLFTVTKSAVSLLFVEAPLADAWPFHVPLEVGIRPVRDGVALATVAGEIDIATVPSLHVRLTPLTSDPAVRLLVCDLSRVTFFGCSGASALLDLQAALVVRGARLQVVANSNVVLRPLSVTGLLDVLTVSPDIPGALH